MADTFPISQSILDWIEQTIDLQKLSSEDQEYFYQWKSHKAEPTYTQLSKFSRHTHIPFGYLFMKDAPKEDLSLVEHRTINSIEFENPSREFMDTYHVMKSIQAWMEDYLESVGAPILAFVGKFNKDHSVSKISAYIREMLDLSPTDTIRANNRKYFNQLRQKISDLGVIVMLNGVVGNNTSRPLDIDEFRGFALLNDRAPLIFINSKDSDTGKTFTLLHELAHILLGQDNLYNDCGSSTGVSKAETLANAVAAEVILPDAVFVDAWYEQAKNKSIDNIITQMAGDFGCSRIMLARKAVDSGFITKNDYIRIAGLSLAADQQSKSGKAKGGGNYYSNLNAKLDSNFIGALNDSVESGHTSYTEAFRLTGTSSKTFREITDLRRASL